MRAETSRNNNFIPFPSKVQPWTFYFPFRTAIKMKIKDVVAETEKQIFRPIFQFCFNKDKQ